MIKSEKITKKVFIKIMYFIYPMVLLFNLTKVQAQGENVLWNISSTTTTVTATYNGRNTCVGTTDYSIVKWYRNGALVKVQTVDLGAGPEWFNVAYTFDYTLFAPNSNASISVVADHYYRVWPFGGAYIYSRSTSATYPLASYQVDLSKPGINAIWSRDRGSVCLDADFYKYRRDTYFHEDLWVNDMVVEYSVDNCPYTELCRIRSNKQPGNRGLLYRTYSFEPRNGNQFEVRNRSTSNDIWVKIIGVNIENFTDYSNAENFTARIHWQIPTAFTGKRIALRYRNPGDVGYDFDATTSSIYNVSRKMNAGTVNNEVAVDAILPSIVATTAWQDNGSVKYTVGNPNGIPLSTKYSIYMNGKLVLPDDKYFSAPVNFFNYTNSELDTVKRYETRTTYSPNPDFAGTPVYNLKSNEQVVKAYVLPGKLNVTFDGCTHYNTVRFSVDSFTDASLYYTTDFELIRAEDSTFTTGIKNLGIITYNANQSDYSLTDPDDHGINTVKTFFYKLRRVPLVTAWGWSVHTRNGIVDYYSRHVKIKTISTTINQEATPTVTVRWDYSNEGVWCSGSSLSIFRDGGSSGSIKLTEITQKSTQEFIDNSTFATCTPYTYRIEIGSANHGTTTLESSSVTLPLDASKAPVLSYFKASKGFYNDRVELEWTIDKGTLSRFLVKRKLYEESGDKFVTIADIATTSSKLYKYIDNQAVPSVYYSYLIVAISDCNGVPSEKELLSDLGFRMPTASVSGRVVYTGDVPVDGCNIIIEGAGQMKNKAVTLGNGLLKIADKGNLLNTGGFSIQAWLKLRVSSNGIIFDKGDQFQILQNGAGLKLNIGSLTQDITYTVPDNKYFHLTILQRNYSSYEVYIDSKLKCTLNGFSSPVKNSNQLVIGSGITGFIDELRIWQIPLTQYDIEGNYDRYISGKEEGLIAYFRLDEEVNEYIFDMSASGSLYNENHGTISGNCPRTNYDIPASEQLSLKGKTDKNGNYLVAGIPYFADGTSYTFTPQLGTHEFNPNQKPLFLSDRSAVLNNVDFTDVSSFKYEGVVTYDGGYYPVEGVSFFIDGRQVIDSKAAPVMSLTDGTYKLKVPIGIHTIEARKYGHTFVRDTTLNFQSDQLVGCNFKDATRIKLIGRIVGGNREAEKPLLFGESVNNIGQATIIMRPVKAAYSLRNGGSFTDIVKHDDGTLSKPANADNDYTIDENKITIHTSQKTGEFVAYVYPEDYTISINTNSVDILNGMTGALYLKNKIQKFYEVRSWVDSILIPATKTQLAYKKAITHTDSVYYHAKLTQTYIVDPEFSIKEANPILKGGLIEKNYLGDSLYISSQAGTNVKDTVMLVTFTNGVPAYLFGRPVYSQGTIYYYKINAYEKYINADNGDIDMTPVTKCKLIIDNTMKVGSANLPEEVAIDSTGKATYSFTGGAPDLTTGLKKFDAALERNGRTFLWANSYEPYLLGGKGTGTNFTTTGPTKILAVLRDPPGSNSYSYLETGSNITTSDAHSVKQMAELTIKGTLKLGGEVTIATGIGVEILVETAAHLDLTAGLKVSQNFSHTWETSTSVTTTKRFQTSSDPLWVGAPGDLFIGNSTNILYGATNNITIAKKEKLTESITEAGDYAIGKSKGIATGLTFGTEFAYTQRDLEQIFIPGWKTLRNNLLLPKGTIVDSTSITRPVFVSLLEKSDPRYGSGNADSAVWHSNVSLLAGVGPSYRIIIPVNYQNNNWQDSVMWCNNQIRTWETVLANNEKQKLEATLIKNQSFTSGSMFEYSKNCTDKSTQTTNFEIMISALLGLETGFEISKTGFLITVEAEIGAGYQYNGTWSSENTKTVGFVLQESGEFDALTVDYKDTKDGSISFNTRAGQTSCPYEDATFTKYYLPGTILSEATMKMEVPKLNVVNSMATQIPANRPGVFTIQMKNESEVDADTWFLLMLDGYTNPDGAIIAIDGQQINESGRTYLVRAGQTLTKTLTLTKGPLAMDYKDIRLVLASTCQFDKTSFTQVLADTAYISASFIPNCSEVTLTYPSNNWVMNTNSGDSIMVRIEDYDVNFANFGYIMLQSKTLSSSTWLQEMKFFANQTAYDKADGPKKLLDPVKDKNIQYWMKIIGADNRYDIRAVAYCVDPASGVILAETPTVISSGVKDMVRPVLFGSAQPANGVLNASDEIQVQFNEEIAEGLVTSNNISVTGIKNGTNTIHTASVHFDGLANSMVTGQLLNLSDKSFTFEAWVKRNRLGKGVIISHGESGGLELGFTPENKIYVKNGTLTIESQKTYSEIGTWNHYAVVFDNEYKKVSVYFNGDFSISDVPFGSYSQTGILRVGVNADKSSFLEADVHELRAWAIAVSRSDISANKSISYNGLENGMIGYWPMNEGKGVTAIDHSRGRNGIISATWALNPSGKSVSLTGEGSSVMVETAQLPLKSTSDYTVEMWFKGGYQTNACLFSAGRGDGEEWGNSGNNAALWFDNNGLLTFASNGYRKTISNQYYLDNLWHHIAISVNRMASANLYIDGNLVADMDARQLTTISAARMYLGIRNYRDKNSFNTMISDLPFKGQIDEFRIWNLSLSEKLINNNINNRLEGNEPGLAAYYPFDAYEGSTLKFSDKNQVLNSTEVAILTNGSASDDYAPVKVGYIPEKLGFVFVTNKDKINIKLTEDKKTIERTLVTITVSNIQDLNENILASPIKWSAYIDQSQLRWDDDQVNLTKPINKDFSFNALVTNTGGTTQEFTLTNLPNWLSVDVQSGSIKAGASKEFTFTVDKGLNIGSYDEVIYLRSEYSQPLGINLLVMAELPDWNVDPAKFSASMNIIASLKINDILSTDINDKVAVFIDGVCAGVAQPAYFKEYGKYFIFLKVYGNTGSQNKKLFFRAFDASSGSIFSAKPPTDISYSDDKINGTLTTPVELTAKDEVCQSIPLNNGWNWISFNVASSDFSTVQTVMSGAKAAAGDIVKDNNLGLFDSYSTTSKKWAGTLTAGGGFNNTSMYLLRISAQTLSVPGTFIDPVTVILSVKGNSWNYLSYIPMVNLNLKEALAGYSAIENDVIKSQYAFAIYDKLLGWVGDLKYLEPNKGYMLYRAGSDNTTFTYPKGYSLKTNAIINPSGIQRFTVGKYPETMGFVAQVESDAGFSDSDWILGYIGNELVSATQMSDVTPRNAPLVFINVQVGGNGSVRFVLEREGVVIGQTMENIQIASNRIFGTLDNPYLLSFKKIREMQTIFVYPNPVEDELHIRIDKAERQNITISVTDLGGKKIIEEIQLIGTENYLDFTLNTCYLNAGVYVLKITVDKKPFFYKLIKDN